MKRSEILRGRGAFKRVLASGSRIDGKTFRLHFRIDRAPRATLQVGFLVPRHIGTAVRRNRIRRLLREALRLEKVHLNESAALKDTLLQVVVVFRGGRESRLPHLRLRDLQDEMGGLLRSLRSRIQPDTQ